jgi:hypothetical protein
VVDVFISHPRSERAKVEPIRARLEALGLDVFIDLHGIDAGDAFPDVIDRALKSAKVVLAVWSPRAFESKWCMIECRVGAMRDILVPVALEQFSALEMKSDFMTTSYLDLTDFNGQQDHERWSQTLCALSRHVGRELARRSPSQPAAPQSHLRSPPLAKPAGFISPQMVRVPAGEFMMGSPPNDPERLNAEGPQHVVQVRAFELGKYPVTFEKWDTAIAAGAALERPDDQGWGRHRRPVINVSWNDAKAYISWLNGALGMHEQAFRYRLPSRSSSAPPLS